MLSTPLLTLSIDDIKNHLDTIKKIYDETILLNKYDLYDYICFEEERYICNLNKYSICDSYAWMVHKLHPVKYINTNIFTNELISTRDMLKCYYCDNKLSTQDAYDVHILNKDVICKICGTIITLESISVMTTIRHFSIKTNEKIGDWKKLINLRRDLVYKYGKYGMIIIIKESHENFSGLKIDLIKAMYRQLNFINKICDNFNYWKKEEIILKSIERYYKFIKLIMIDRTNKTNLIFVPTVDIDLVWHTHQCDIETYVIFCGKKMIDHDDTINLHDSEKSYADTYTAWKNQYNEIYSIYYPKALKKEKISCCCFKINIIDKNTPMPDDTIILGTPVMYGKINTTTLIEPLNANLDDKYYHKIYKYMLVDFERSTNTKSDAKSNSKSNSDSNNANYTSYDNTSYNLDLIIPCNVGYDMYNYTTSTHNSGGCSSGGGISSGGGGCSSSGGGGECSGSGGCSSGGGCSSN